MGKQKPRKTPAAPRKRGRSQLNLTLDPATLDALHRCAAAQKFPTERTTIAAAYIERGLRADGYLK